MKVLEASPFIENVQLERSSIILVNGKEVTEFALSASSRLPIVVDQDRFRFSLGEVAMASLPKGQREQGLLLLCVIAILSIGAYWNFVYSKGAADIDVRRQHADALVTMNQKAKMEVAKGNVNEIRRELAEYQQNLVLIRSLVPTGNEVPSLLGGFRRRPPRRTRRLHRRSAARGRG